MSKEQYLKKLRSLIHALPAENRRKVIDFYRKMIEDKMKNGKTEQQAVAELGDAFLLAQKILEENPNRRQYDGNRIAGIAVASFFAVFIIAGLVFNGLKVSGRLPAYSAEQSVQTESGEQKVVKAPVSGVNKITIQAEGKEITVRPGGGDQIVITYQTGGTQTYAFTNQNGEVKLVNYDREKWNFFRFFDAARGTKIELTIPKSYAGEVFLHTSNGQTSVGNVEGLAKLTCETSNAPVTVSDVTAKSLTADTSNARIRMEQVNAGTVHASTSNGAVEFSALASPDITLDTSNGAIRGDVAGEETDYTVRTDTSNGSCTPQSRSGGSKRLFADTSNASIAITFSKGR